MVPLAAKPEPVVVDLAQTALVVVDMQNAFLSKGGMFDLAGFDLSGAAKAILGPCPGTGAWPSDSMSCS